MLSGTPHSNTGDDDEDGTTKTKGTSEQRKGPGEEGIDNRSLFDPSYLADVYREFYRELANAYTGMMNGFRKYK